ncbi:hypothetical protein C483_00460 [Natrialba hulunbeirensis JCM 10989]|uniref:Uncharacterized protein n=1 Tax=Natrialba hulunbeirensis JCM 10989 TaxID=1227493 RepID=M0AE00_9EURY|nr:hypothetical protein [Natrialba hulunbeirensis]ELY96087.1 hypothetical protein C483_00460 [Natrialba hulunbeirensis JCM 10989]
MNERKIKTRNEPDDPVETKILDVSSIELDKLSPAFNSHWGAFSNIGNQRFTSKLEQILDIEGWEVTRVIYQTYLPKIWVGDHQNVTENNESDLHKHLKILAAGFLDRTGHEMETVKNWSHDGTSGHNREWVYDPFWFEVPYSPGVADVACDCTDCNTYVEVGDTPARKVYEACQSPSIDSVVVIPYKDASDFRFRGEIRHVYFFHEASVRIPNQLENKCLEHNE